MNVISILNTTLAFILEIIALIAVAYLGTTFSNTQIFKIILAVVFVTIMMILWGAFFAPKANYRLTMPWLFIGKLILLLIPSYIKVDKRNFVVAGVYSAIVILHLVVATIQNEM